jgi:hypothetical protein
MERRSPADRLEAPRPRDEAPRPGRLALALAFALVAHVVVVLGADPFEAALRRLRAALGLAPAADTRAAAPRDDDWIRIEFELPPAQASIPPRPRLALLRPPPPVDRPLTARPRRRLRLASLTSGPPPPVIAPGPTKPGSTLEPARPRPAGRRWLQMRPPGARTPPAIPPPPRPAHRRLDLVYRPAPGELRVSTADKGRLRVAGQTTPAIPRVAGPVHDTGRWTPLPARLALKGLLPRGRFHVTRRGVPVYAGVALKRVGRGRWRYHGPACTFNATVHPDGQVTFRDRPPVELGGVTGSPPLQIPGDSQARAFSGIVVGVSFRFDVTDAIMRRLGQDPYSAEKRRFARLTRAWRSTLRGAYRRRVRSAALARFGPDAGLCRRYRALDPAGRRRTRRWLFARWDETREDADGQILRNAVLAAIRRCAIRYDPTELARLNASRRVRGRQRFTPHLAAPGAPPGRGATGAAR